MKATERRAYYSELDGYRGIAALLIVLLHAYQKPGVSIDRTSTVGFLIDLIVRNLDIAVDWFFVLSGFLLFLPFARAALEQRGMVSARLFLVRRMFRLIPAYYVVLLIFWVEETHGRLASVRDLIAHLTFTHIFDPLRMFSIVGPAWSLADEVVYSLLIPIPGLLCYALCRLSRSRRTRVAVMVLTVLLFCGISLAYDGYLLRWGNITLENFPQHFQPLARFNTFGFGMLLAVAVADDKPRLVGRVPVLCRCVGDMLLLLTFLLPALGQAGAVFFPTASGLAFTIVLGSTLLGDRRMLWVRMLSLPPLQFLGTISYGMYLWHEPILTLLLRRQWLIRPAADAIPMNIALTVAIAIACGSASYWLVERPTMGLQRIISLIGWRVFIERPGTALERASADGGPRPRATSNDAASGAAIALDGKVQR